MIDDPAQRVAPHGLHHRVTVRPGGEARPYAHYHRCVGDGRAQIPLGQDGVHLRVGPQGIAAPAFRIGQHRDDALRQQRFRLRRVRRPYRRHVLHRLLPVDDGLGEGHRPPDGGGRGQVGHHDLHMAAEQPQGDAGGDIPRASYQHAHKKTSFFRMVICLILLVG